MSATNDTITLEEELAEIERSFEELYTRTRELRLIYPRLIREIDIVDTSFFRHLIRDLDVSLEVLTGIINRQFTRTQ